MFALFAAKNKDTLCLLRSHHVPNRDDHRAAGLVQLVVAQTTAATARRPSQPASGGMFKVLSGADTGLKKIIEDWSAEALEKAGGKGDGSWWLWGLTALDIDNDGDADFVPTHHSGLGGLILKNQFKETGKVTFVNVTAEMGVESRNLPSAIGRRTWPMDLNGDGFVDLAGIRSPHYLNEGGKKLTATGKKQFDGLHPESVRDVNGDGYPDIIEPLNVHVWDLKAGQFRPSRGSSTSRQTPADAGRRDRQTHQGRAVLASLLLHRTTTSTATARTTSSSAASRGTTSSRCVRRSRPMRTGN